MEVRFKNNKLFINLFTIAMSSLLEEEEDSEIYCNLDDDGYIFDEDNDYVLDTQGKRVKLTEQQIEKFNNNNMIEQINPN